MYFKNKKNWITKRVSYFCDHNIERTYPMKKNIIFLALIGTMILACKGNKSNEKGDTTSTEQTEFLEIPDIPQTVSSQPMRDEIQIYTVKIGNDPNKSNLTASFPVTPYDFVNENEKKFTQVLIDEFKTELKRRNKQESVSELGFSQHFEIKFKSQELLVLLYTQNVSYGNNYDMRHRVSLFDIKNKKKLDIKDLFQNELAFKNFSSEIKNLARQELENYIKKDEHYANDKERKQVLASLEEMLQRGTEPTEQNYDALFFDEKGGWFIIFDKYQIASGAMGEFLIPIPKGVINKYIHERFLKPFVPKKSSEIPPQSSTPSPISTIDCSKVPCVALTFDDGPSIYTGELLDILKKENVKATFFVLGQSASVQKNTVKRIADEGHNIGNHSYDHKDFRKISDTEARRQIDLTDEIIQEITGEKPKYFRFPYGAHTKENLAMVERPIILWNVDPLDWKHKDVSYVTKAMSKGSPQAIILAHDIHKTTVQAIPQVIKNLKEQGYHIVSLDDLFRHKKITNGTIYSDGN